MTHIIIIIIIIWGHKPISDSLWLWTASPALGQDMGTTRSCTQGCTPRSRSHQHWQQLQPIASRDNKINCKAGDTPVNIYVYLKVQACSSQQPKSHLQASAYGLSVLLASLPPRLPETACCTSQDSISIHWGEKGGCSPSLRGTGGKFYSSASYLNKSFIQQGLPTLKHCQSNIYKHWDRPVPSQARARSATTLTNIF